MDNIILYTTNCPKCRILEQRLDDLGLSYTKVTDQDVMIQKGFVSAPMLEVNGEEALTFPQAYEFLNDYKGV